MDPITSAACTASGWICFLISRDPSEQAEVAA